MKKLLMVLVVVFLFASLTAQAETLTAGNYVGTTTSVIPEVNGQAATAVLKTEGNKTIATVVTKDGTEVWTWDGVKLIQQALDATGKPVDTYAANNVNGQYQINCTDKAKGVCDAQVDPRAYWTISNTANSFTYTYYNIANNQKTNPTTQNAERIKMVFNLAK